MPAKQCALICSIYHNIVVEPNLLYFRSDLKNNKNKFLNNLIESYIIH